MKKLTLVLAFVLALIPAVAATGAFAAEDFTGKWSGSFIGTDPGGQQITETVLMILTHKGTDLTGTAGPNENTQWKIQNGKVDGNKVAFDVQGGDGQGGPLLKFTMTFAEGHLKGDIAASRGEEKMAAKVDVTRVK
jgi:hypothetical protein